MLKNNLLIKSISKKPLVLNESYDSTSEHKKYIFSGVFTACSVPGHVIINRNNRSYPEKEVLKHLGYLRESIQQNGCLLGELDHPEGRFDIQLKEASHKITDLWYDQSTHCVMGKLELLDTPNGKIAQELVEAKYPLFVSSRAAGDVNEKTHEVNIAQIFTYDIVCTPGFAEAKLNQVSESLNTNAYRYLTESVNNQVKESINTKKYNLLVEGVSITETEQVAPINERAMIMKSQPINLNNLCKPLLEEDEEFKLPEADVTPPGASLGGKSKNVSEEEKSEDSDEKKSEDSKEEKSEDSKEEKTEDSKEEKSEDSKEEKSEDSKEEDDEETLTDEEKEKNKKDILNIEAIEKESDEDSKSKEDKSDILDIEAKEKESDDKEDSEQVEEKVSKKIENDVKKDMDKFQQILDNLQKVESVKESIVRNYPFATSLSPENFAKFAALKPEQKQKCMKFIVENNIYDIKSINDLWSTPLNEEKRLLKNWLRLASPEDIALYTQASIEEQNAIENMARYCILETKQDVDEFWFKTGLRQKIARQKLNENFIKQYKIQQKPVKEVQESTHPLGYSMDYVKMTEQLYNEM